MEYMHSHLLSKYVFGCALIAKRKTDIREMHWLLTNILDSVSA